VPANRSERRADANAEHSHDDRLPTMAFRRPPVDPGGGVISVKTAQVQAGRDPL
jgi:hypothetical protein